jgi:hypothetical protein
MVVVPFLRNNPSVVVFSSIYIFCQKNSGENFRSASGFFIAGIPFVKKTRVIVLVLPSNMM